MGAGAGRQAPGSAEPHYPLREVARRPALPGQSCAAFDSRGKRNRFSDPARIPLEAVRQFPKAVVYMQASNLLLQLMRELRPLHGPAPRLFAVQSRYAEQDTVWT
jgi:hypothetical protein